jgi:hypothetical protein
MRRIIGTVGATLAIIVAGVTSAGAGAYGPGIQETNRTDIVELAASANNAVQLYKDFASALPGPHEYPPEGQEFFTASSEKYGEENPDPYATYGDDAIVLAGDLSPQDALEHAQSDLEQALATF